VISGAIATHASVAASKDQAPFLPVRTGGESTLVLPDLVSIECTQNFGSVESTQHQSGIFG
jgi:hypothetical protein